MTKELKYDREATEEDLEEWDREAGVKKTKLPNDRHYKKINDYFWNILNDFYRIKIINVFDVEYQYIGTPEEYKSAFEKILAIWNKHKITKRDPNLLCGPHILYTGRSVVASSALSAMAILENHHHLSPELHLKYLEATGQLTKYDPNVHELEKDEVDRDL